MSHSVPSWAPSVHCARYSARRTQNASRVLEAVSRGIWSSSRNAAALLSRCAASADQQACFQRTNGGVSVS